MRIIVARLFGGLATLEDVERVADERKAIAVGRVHLGADGLLRGITVLSDTDQDEGEVQP
tara:strand:+ start:806 stop:985 length:180 start_codon:yes stop_codon:yes gene_type:complete